MANYETNFLLEIFLEGGYKRKRASKRRSKKKVVRRVESECSIDVVGMIRSP